MASPLLIRGARQLLTLRDAADPRCGSRMNELGLVPDGSVLIRGCCVEQAGSTRRILNLNDARGAVEIDASGCVVLPGFVDPRIELFPENYTAAFPGRIAAKLMAAGTTAFRCGPPPRKAATLWKTLIRSFPDATAGTAVNPAIQVLLPIAAFTRRGTGAMGDNVGSAFAIATDFESGHQPVCSMQTAISLAVLHLGLTVEQALAAATTNAAHAIGLGERLGSIEPGRQADLLILAIPDYREIPYHLGESLVRMVIKKGRKVIDRGEK